MDAQELRSLQEAYMEVVMNELDEGASGDVAARAKKLANQRKGQTPERKKMYQDLANKASERETGPRIIDVGGRGKRKGLTQSDRDARREYDAEFSYETGDKNSTPGPGTITKNKRKLAAQKARGQHAEQYDYYDIILSHLLDEGYAETEDAAQAIMVNMSEEWRESIVEEVFDEALTGERYKKAVKKPGGTAYSRMVSPDPAKRATRGGRGGESDFGAGDRGSGNKAARRAGTYKDKED
jgi:hypothetical protein